MQTDIAKIPTRKLSWQSALNAYLDEYASNATVMNRSEFETFQKDINIFLNEGFCALVGNPLEPDIMNHIFKKYSIRYIVTVNLSGERVQDTPQYRVYML